MESLMDFTLPHWSSVPVYLLPALISFGLLAYALFWLPNSQRNRLFCLFIFLIASSQVADAFIHFSTTVEQALTWQKICMAPILLIPAVGIIFVLTFNPRTNSGVPLWLYPLIFIPAFFLIMLASVLGDNIEMKYTENLGWIVNPVPTIYNAICYGYITLGSFMMPAILWYNWKRTERTNARRKKLMLLFIGISIPVVGGIIAEILFPLVLGVDGIPIAGPPLMISFPVCALIAMRRYNMLSFSPRKQWETILDTISEGILIADNERKIMYINPALCNLLEYDVAELLGREADELILNNSLHGTTFNADREFQMPTKAGKLVWVVTKLSPCLDENRRRIGTIWTITDIDDLKKKSIEIKRSEKRLNRAQSVAHVGHWDLDFSTGIATWSPEACRIYGLQPHESSQSFESWLSFIHPEDIPHAMREIQKSNQDFNDADFEHRIVLKDGTVKHIRSISKFEFDGTSSRPIGLYGVAQDISEIKTAYEQLNVTTLELETYIYKSSHDLHAPLSTILGLINVGRREITDPLASQYLGMIEGQARKLESIRTDFIKAMLIKDAASFDEKIQLNEMIPEIINNLNNTFGFERVKINVNIPDSRPLQSNSYLIKTILQNLIENSVKYQDYKSIAKLQIDVERNDKNAKITIADNGIGIAEEFQNRIFDMYFRGTELGSGSGLGLYLVKKAVDKLNGQLSLRSRPGEGTTFTIMLKQAS